MKVFHTTRASKSLNRWLRRPAVVVSEVSLLVTAMLLSTFIPQVSRNTLEAQRFTENHPALASLVNVLALDRIFSSYWFLAVVLLAACSLSLALKDQWRRALRLWRRSEEGGRLPNAPFRYEVEVPLAEPLRESRVRYRDSLRLGLCGSPLFHLGLLTLLVAGLLRPLFGTDAVVDLMEGETLPPSSSEYGAQWPGLLAEPFSLRDPLTLQHLQVDMYPTGKLRGFSAQVKVGSDSQTVAINAPLSTATEALYLTSTYGPALFLTTDLGENREGHALLLRAAPDGRYGAKLVLPNGVQILATTRKQLAPASVELRVLQSGALIALETLKPGEGIRLSDNRMLNVEGIVQWARFTARRDISTPVAYTGFALTCLGAFLIYGVIRVESAIVWEPTPAGVRLKVAMRPQRFAPLFAARFERLVAESRAELKVRGGEVDVSDDASLG